jgi:hypothetical protein
MDMVCSTDAVVGGLFEAEFSADGSASQRD